MSDRLEGSSSSNPLMYKGYAIYVGPRYTKDLAWEYIHEDYDGPEDNRYGHCASIDECKAEIDDALEETGGPTPNTP